MCGEKEAAQLKVKYPAGSPPRMRGKVAERLFAERLVGITPTYAGKSTRGHDAGKPAQDHPRICGEKYPVMDDAFIDMGSPPRVRGKGRFHCGLGQGKGITPAYAGKSATTRMPVVWARDHPRVCGERLKRSHSIGHFSCILCLFHSVLHRASASGGSRAGPCAPPCLPAQNAVPV